MSEQDNSDNSGANSGDGDNSQPQQQQPTSTGAPPAHAPQHAAQPAPQPSPSAEGADAPSKPADVADAEWDALGDPGRKALVRERQARAEAERAAKEAQGQIESAKQEGQAAAMREAAGRLASAEARAVAAGAMQDPEDLVRYVDVNEFVSDDGNVDRDGLKAKMDALIEERPYLSAARQPDRSGVEDAGARGAGPQGQGTSMDQLLRAAAGRA